MGATRPVEAPRIEPLRLEGLRDIEPTLLRRNVDLDGARFAGIRLTGVDIGGGSAVVGCEFDHVLADEFDIASARVAETRFRQLGVPVLKMARTALRQVEFDGGRLGAVEAYDVDAKSVHFIGCRVNYLNLRGAELLDVAFTDCEIDEIDLIQASARRLWFPGTRIGMLALHDSSLTDVDLRGADLSGITGVTSLKGATISTEQLVVLAPQLAAGLGIDVLD